jgi:chitin disaccharide deacetylase
MSHKANSKPLFCADDFALHPNISIAIIRLLKEHKIQATSCMSHSEYWPEHAQWLHEIPNKEFQQGLHLNLTEGKPLSFAASLIHHGQFHKLPQFIHKAWKGDLNSEEIFLECEAQLLRFKEYSGQLPDFIDGHQHIHCLPLLHPIIEKLHKKYLSNKEKFWIRLPLQPFYKLPFCYCLKANMKSQIIAALGGRKLEKWLKKQNINFNTSFGGIYDFNDSLRHYPKLLQQFKNCSQDSVIMCHPGLPHKQDPNDPILNSRYQEYISLSLNL